VNSWLDSKRGNATQRVDATQHIAISGVRRAQSRHRSLGAAPSLLRELSPSADKNCTCFKWIGEWIKSRAAMQIATTNVCLVSLTTRYFLGYPYMKLNVALAASIAALALMTACAKKDAEVAAPAEAAPAATEAAAAATDAAAAATDAAATATDAAATATDAASTATDAAAAPAADPAAAPAEAPKQ
jgi:hypothetical protein